MHACVHVASKLAGCFIGVSSVSPWSSYKEVGEVQSKTLPVGLLFSQFLVGVTTL